MVSVEGGWVDESCGVRVVGGREGGGEGGGRGWGGGWGRGRWEGCRLVVWGIVFGGVERGECFFWGGGEEEGRGGGER